MALTVKQYAVRLWDIRVAVSRQLGSDVSVADIATRAEAMSSDVVTAVILKLLVDKGVFTDAQLNTAAQAIIGATFPQLPIVVASSMDGAGDVPDPDLGA